MEKVIKDGNLPTAKQPTITHDRQEGVTKFITVAEMRDFEQKVSTGEWSYTHMVNHLCKMAEQYRNQPQQVREWKEECERLAKVAEFWQGKYNELNPGFIPAKLDHL